MVSTDSIGLIVCFWLFWANFGPIQAQFRSKMAKFDSKLSKFGILRQYSCSVPKTDWKSGLFWLSTPLVMYLAIRAKFGPLKANISKIGRETYPQNFTMIFPHTQLLENGPIFVGGVFLIFGLGQILAEPDVSEITHSSFENQKTVNQFLQRLQQCFRQSQHY